MINILPSQNLNLLKSFIGKRIVSVQRQLFKDDLDLDDWEQSADGPIELTIEDDSSLHFFAKTEMFSMGLAAGKMPQYGDSYVLKNISNNSFWSNRVGQKIVKVKVLKASDSSEDYPSEFGLEILFSNGEKVLIEYLNDQEHLDMIRVSNSYLGPCCITYDVQ